MGNFIVTSFTRFHEEYDFNFVEAKLVFRKQLIWSSGQIFRIPIILSAKENFVVNFLVL